jgi:hypothetical protein
MNKIYNTMKWLLFALAIPVAFAQAPSGADVYQRACASCHEQSTADRIPQALAGRPLGKVPEPEGADQQPKVSGRFLVAWDPIAEKERWRIVDNGPRLAGAAAFNA